MQKEQNIQHAPQNKTHQTTFKSTTVDTGIEIKKKQPEFYCDRIKTRIVDV